MNYVLIFINIVLLVAGQTLWKIGIAGRPLHGIKGAVLALFSPWVMAGIVLYVIATVVWIYLLSKLPLSLLYPLQSLAYVAAVVVAVFIFKEQVSVTRWVGVLVILLGAALVVK